MRVVRAISGRIAFIKLTIQLAIIFACMCVSLCETPYECVTKNVCMCVCVSVVSLCVFGSPLTWRLARPCRVTYVCMFVNVFLCMFVLVSSLTGRRGWRGRGASRPRGRCRRGPPECPGSNALRGECLSLYSLTFSLAWQCLSRWSVSMLVCLSVCVSYVSPCVCMSVCLFVCIC